MPTAPSIQTISLPHQRFLTDELFLKIHSVSKKNSFDLEGLPVHLFCCYFPWVIRAPFYCNHHYLQQLQVEKFCPSTDAAEIPHKSLGLVLFTWELFTILFAHR